jgi:iron complex transport system ATP-binding protein
MSALITFAGVSFSYGEKSLLDEVSLEVRDSEFLGIVGPNGAGKTTLLRLMTGYLAPSRGRVEIGGVPLRDISHADLARKMALVPQKEEALFPYPVRSMVLFGRYPHISGFGFERGEDHACVNDALDLLKIRELADRPVTELSGGELHRVIIARALAQDTPILLLDEPNAHLDIRYQIALFELLRMLNIERRKTIVCVTHDLNLAAAFSHRVALLAGGGIAAIGAPAEVLTPERIRDCFGISAGVDVENRNGVPRVTVVPDHLCR